MRKVPFVNGEFYHIFNRGVDKRDVFKDEYDVKRFFQSMGEFNVFEPIGSLFEKSVIKKKFGGRTAKLNEKPLVNLIAYCLNSNHFHFILEQVSENGISEFMKRLSGGYAWYFNNKYKRSGTLFQGRFKSIHIDSNEYLLHLSAYVNLNNRVHKFGGPTAKLLKNYSSWNEYLNGDKNNFCKKDIILEQFKNENEYKNFAENSLEEILNKKEKDKDLNNILLE